MHKQALLLDATHRARGVENVQFYRRSLFRLHRRLIDIA